MAYAAGRLFVPVVELCSRESAVTSKNAFARPPSQGRGTVYALDAATGKTVWQAHLGSAPFGCATVARDAVIVPTYDGRVVAFAAADGRALWQTQLACGQQQLSGCRQGRSRRCGRRAAPGHRASGHRGRRLRSRPLTENRELECRRWRVRATLASILLIVSAAFALVLGAAGATAGATAPAKWIVFSATQPGQHIDQLFRIRSSGAGLKRLTKGQYRVDRSRLLTRRNADRLCAHRRRDRDDERRRQGRASPDDERPGQLSDLVAGRQTDRVPAADHDVVDLRHVVVRWPSASVGEGSAGGSADLELRRAHDPFGGDLAKIDPANGHVLKYFGAEIDAVWGLNTVALSPDGSSLTFIGAAAPEPGDKECGDNQPCQRFALYKRRSSSEDQASAARQERRAGDVLTRRETARLHRTEHQARPLDALDRRVEAASARQQLRHGRCASGVAAVKSPRRPQRRSRIQTGSC